MRVLVVEDESADARQTANISVSLAACKKLPSLVAATDGCGLGLSIAQWIAAAHHGSVRIESALGEKTVVTVRLPVASEK